MEKTIGSVDEMYAIAREMVEGLVREPTAVVLGLTGDLGSGKTTFTQGVSRALGVEETVTSPTFVLEKIYDLDGRSPAGFTRLVHIDAYRLEHPHELSQLGFDALAADSRNLILVEWPERVAEALPASVHYASFRFINETTRGVTFI